MTFHKFESIKRNRMFYIDHFCDQQDTIEEWKKDRYDSFQLYKTHKFNEIERIKHYFSDIEWNKLMQVIFELL